MERKHPAHRPSSSQSALRDSPETFSPDEPQIASEHWLSGPAVAAPDSTSCKRYMQQRLAAVLPLIANGLINEALNGDLPALKLILQMAELEDKEPEPAGPPHRCKTLEEMLIEDWQKEPLDEPKS